MEQSFCLVAVLIFASVHPDARHHFLLRKKSFLSSKHQLRTNCCKIALICTQCTRDESTLRLSCEFFINTIGSIMGLRRTNFANI